MNYSKSYCKRFFELRALSRNARRECDQRPALTRWDPYAAVLWDLLSPVLAI